MNEEWFLILLLWASGLATGLSIGAILLAVFA